MNIDLSIHRMAFREADSLSVAQLLVAKKKADLGLRELRERVLEGSDSAAANARSTLRRMEDASEAVRQAAEQRARAEPADDTHVDKTA